jgi:hypothetical protein
VIEAYKPLPPHQTFRAVIVLRRIYNYVVAQRLVPFPLPASERELRRWDALGEAYTALLEIKYAKSLQSAREFAAGSADRVRESCRQP